MTRIVNKFKFTRCIQNEHAGPVAGDMEAGAIDQMNNICKSTNDKNVIDRIEREKIGDDKHDNIQCIIKMTRNLFFMSNFTLNKSNTQMNYLSF